MVRALSVERHAAQDVARVVGRRQQGVEKKISAIAASSEGGKRMSKEGEDLALSAWIEKLKKNANIKVDYNLLEKK